MLIESLVAIAAVTAVSEASLADLAEEGDRAAIETRLLTPGIDVNEAQGDGMTALHWAAFHDDLELAKLLVAAKANLEVRTRVGSITPLILASTNGSADMLELLLDSGADPNHASANGTTALMGAAMSGSVAAVNVLIDAAADVNARDTHHGQTPLMFAAWENRPRVIRTLIGRGAHPELASNVLVLDEPRFDDEGNPRRRRKGREQSGGNSAMGGMTALLFAAREGHLESVTALVDSGADVNHVAGSDASSPMVIAIANGHYTVAKYLLDHGADANAANIDGVTALYATVNMRYAPVSWAPNPPTGQEVVGSLELIESLLEAGANPNARVLRKLWFSPTSHDRGWVDHAGGTAFWRAAMSSDVEVMRTLVAAGADPNFKTDQGTTPLMVAAGLGWIGNFSQNAPDSFLAAVEYCLELGGDINAVDEDGYTALHGAAARGDREMVQWLVDHGARVDILNKDGNSAADMAYGPSRFFIPKPETAALLVELGAPFQDNCRSDQCVDGKFLGGPVAK